MGKINQLIEFTIGSMSFWLVILYQPYNTSTSLGDNWDLNYVFVPKRI